VIGRVSLAIELPWIHRPLGVVKLDMEEATLTLSRNDAGLANWQWKDPRVPDDTLLPLVRHLSVPGARVLLKDDTRHLQFDGTITVKEPTPVEGPPPLRIEGTGRLNGRPVHFAIDGDPLAAGSRQTLSTAEEQSTRNSRAAAPPRPFDSA
jgi:hypothetical protein